MDEETTISVRFTGDQLAAIDAWIARHDDPKPDRAAAVQQLIAGRLASDRPSTMMPGLVTGRDIV